jgi:hypothetical protein
MKIAGDQAYVATWGVMGLVAAGIAYLLIKYALPSIAKSAANAATQSHDLSGAPVNYGGFGLPGVLGGATNTALGGAPASLGESIGSGLFSIFGSAPTGSTTYYRTTFPDGSVHAIGNATVDANSRFTYGGQTYTLGDDGYGNKIATALSTVYGSGSGGSNADLGGSNFGAVDPTTWN